MLLALSPAVSTVTCGPETEILFEEIAHLLHPLHAHACLEQEDEDEEWDTHSYHGDRETPVASTYSEFGDTEDGLLWYQLADRHKLWMVGECLTVTKVRGRNNIETPVRILMLSPCSIALLLSFTELPLKSCSLKLIIS